MLRAFLLFLSSFNVVTCHLDCSDNDFSLNIPAVLSVDKLPQGGPFNTLDPFLFLVYHQDNYPPGDENMSPGRKGNGADFDPSAPYRMYHGRDRPGFPQHPHRGFETLTATIEGLIDHADSLGNAGRYGHGDLQWMTAGRGVCHGEMFPLVHADSPNPTRFFQIWLNLPSKSKMADPAFVMHWAPDIPRHVSSDGRASVTVWAGEFMGLAPLSPPPDSYATSADAEVAVWRIELLPGGEVRLPPAAGGEAVNRRAYVVEGTTLTIGDTTVHSRSMVTLNAAVTAALSNPTTSVVEVLVLQGKPIGERVAKHGPFVMNSRAEIDQAFADYRATQFGGWPWPDSGMVFPREKARFALIDGVEHVPPQAVASH